MSNWTKEDLADHFARMTKVGECGLINPSLSPGIDPQVTGPAKGRLPVPKGMNKTETAYAAHLQALYLAQDILWWGFEAIRVRIGHDCFLNPDFLVMYKDHRLELHDTKGTKKGKPRAEDDAIVKARAISASFPIPIYFVFRDLDGEWTRKEM